MNAPKKQPTKMAAPVKLERTFQRFTIGQRWEHGILILSVTGLLFTGLPQKYQTTELEPMDHLFSREIRADPADPPHLCAAVDCRSDLPSHPWNQPDGSPSSAGNDLPDLAGCAGCLADDQVSALPDPQETRVWEIQFRAEVHLLVLVLRIRDFGFFWIGAVVSDSHHPLLTRRHCAGSLSCPQQRSNCSGCLHRDLALLPRPFPTLEPQYFHRAAERRRNARISCCRVPAPDRRSSQSRVEPKEKASNACPSSNLPSCPGYTGAAYRCQLIPPAKNSGRARVPGYSCSNRAGHTHTRACSDGHPTPTGNLSISDEVCLGCHGQPGPEFKLQNGDILDLYCPGGDAPEFHPWPAGLRLRPVPYHRGRISTPSFSATDRRNVTEQLNEVCARCHRQQNDFTKDSAHEAARDQGVREAALCVDCHTAHEVRQLHDPRTGQLLKDARPGFLSAAPYATMRFTRNTRESVHGAALSEGNPDVPTCIDCHGVHNIADPRTATISG